MHERQKIERFNAILAKQSIFDRLQTITQIAPKSIFTTSLGREDQVLLWNICASGGSFRIVTLNTGRLFNETKSLIRLTKDRYDLDIEEFEPDATSVENYIQKYGENGFYNSVEERKECCAIRKIAPLADALKGANGWVTGLTREQSDGRSEIPFVEWDDAHELIKFNPIADMKAGEIDASIAAHEIPVNPLHFKGYPSIGCEPCTRAVKSGEHPRAGRWWWEQQTSSECGLHLPIKQTQQTSLTG